MATLQFAPWTSEIELQFYAALASLKINHDRLNDSARKVLGLYELKPADKVERSNRMQIHGTALTTDDVPNGYLRAEGFIKNYNTFEEYKNVDRAKIIEFAARTIWDAIQDETIYSCPSLLCSFYAISFANLKKYRFTYHFAFPALHSDPPWKLVNEAAKLETKETTLLVEAVQTWKYRVDARQHGFFLAKRMYKGHEFEGATKDNDADQDQDQRPKTPVTPGLVDELGFSWAVGSLADFKRGFFRGVEKQDQYICFADASNFSQNPGWALRNLLVLVRQKWGLDDIQVICYRDTHSRRDQAHSLVLHLRAQPIETSHLAATGKRDVMPKATGWERTEANKLTSKTVDLAAYMDPTRLADQAVDLNLKLIKWRIAPSIDLDIIKSTSCLLLGAGTLGSYVSRNLMGWGVRKVTFVDNATVSFSNPVRQPLFNFKDCLDGGVKKAHRAADMLQEIYPGVDSRGHTMNVPMVGHPIVDEAKTKNEFETLQKLIDEHDAIFLLLDTREARWLPTVMGKAAGKIVLNAALGFDTYVIMRHGLPTDSEDAGEAEMGCYFCNDVVAPADSLKDATLDQQCTVTRPGIAPIASALLVEMLVSILQHPLGARAPASKSVSEQSSSAFEPAATTATSDSSSTSPATFKHPLGALPHTLRGFLSSFSALQIQGQPYDSCSACSTRIIKRYQDEGWDFVKRALTEKGYVEEVSGLAEVQRRAEQMEKEIDWDEGDEDADEGDGELL